MHLFARSKRHLLSCLNIGNQSPDPSSKTYDHLVDNTPKVFTRCLVHLKQRSRECFTPGSGRGDQGVGAMGGWEGEGGAAGGGVGGDVLGGAH